MGVLLASVEPCGQLMEGVLVYGLDQLDCCGACGSDYSLAVLNLLSLVYFLNCIICLSAADHIIPYSDLKIKQHYLNFLVFIYFLLFSLVMHDCPS